MPETLQLILKFEGLVTYLMDNLLPFTVPVIRNYFLGDMIHMN